jgi:hypothetical protein
MPKQASEKTWGHSILASKPKNTSEKYSTSNVTDLFPGVNDRNLEMPVQSFAIEDCTKDRSALTKIEADALGKCTRLKNHLGEPLLRLRQITIERSTVRD